MPSTIERTERWRVPTHLDTPDGLGPFTARQLELLAGAGLYVGPMLAWLAGPVGPALGFGIPFVASDLTVGQAAAMSMPVAAALPFAMSGDLPLEHGLVTAAQHYMRPRLLGGAAAARLSGVQLVDGAVVRAIDGPPLRAVWELPAVNTRLMDPALLAAFRESYAEFLNAITFPFQVVVRATPIDTEPLLRCLDDWADERATQLADWLRALMRGRGLIERRRWLAVSADDEAQYADRVEAIEQGLAGLELPGRRCGVDENGQSTHELCDLLQSGWSRRAVKRGGSVGAGVVHTDPYALQTDGIWHSVVALAQWPEAIDDDWLRRLVGGSLPLDVVWHFTPVDSASAQARLNKRLHQWQSSRHSVARQIAIEDAEHLREALERGQERVWDTAILLLARGKTRDEARTVIRKAQRLLAEQGAQANELRWEQPLAVAACQPMADLQLRRRTRRLDTSSVARTLPFGASELVLDGGVPIGETKEGSRPVVWTPYRRPLLPNAHLAVFGPPGCGKGVFVKVTYSRLYLARIVQQIDVIDQDAEHATGEYGRFAEYCGGHVHYLEHASQLDSLEYLNRKADVLVWNLAGMPICERPGAFVKIKGLRWRASKGGRIRAALILDELWAFLREQEAADAAEEVVRLGRHIKLSGVYMTQRATDCLVSPQGQLVLSSASSQWYGHMQPAELTAVAGPLELPESVRATIRRFRQGDGLLIAGPYQVTMRVIPTPAELAMAQTDYEDLGMEDEDDAVGGDREERSDGVPVAADD